MTDPSDAPRPPAGDAGVGTGVESSFDLLIRAKKGDEQAKEKLCALYLTRLSRWAHGRLPASSRGLLETQDIVQDVLIHAIKRVDQFEPRHHGAFRGYLRQTLLNRLRDEGRKAGRSPEVVALDEERATDDPSPLEQAIGREALERYEAALKRLEPRERDIITARVELGFSNPEIAAEFGWRTTGAAQMAVSRALLKLAAAIAEGEVARV